jgi:hypothetical protein
MTLTKTKKTASLLLLTAALATALVALPATDDARGRTPNAPRGFFGIAPQTPLGDDDLEHMRAGRIGALRLHFSWGAVQPTPRSGYDWSGYDAIVAAAARRGIRILPFVYGTPRWAAPRETILPINNARQRRGWAGFLESAVERYGPRGEFWREHWRGSADPVPKVPLRDWQLWNEANFFYFAKPASPFRYARLLKLSNRAIKRADPAAKTVLSGLFAEPSAKPPNAMHAVDFLERLYRVPGIKASFDGVALHPYAESALDLRRMTEELREVMLDNRDAGARLYLTEIGWGSDNNPNLVSFEQGVGFQLREMRRAYAYMIRNRHRLNLQSAYWFTWKDIAGSCNFCDSTGFFRDSERLRPKPAWRAFVRISRGRVRP